MNSNSSNYSNETNFDMGVNKKKNSLVKLFQQFAIKKAGQYNKLSVFIFALLIKT